MTTDLDLSGWLIRDNFGIRHVFGSGTILPADQAMIVFSGGNWTTAAVGGALFDIASTGTLGLNNSGDTVSILNTSAVVQASQTFSAATAGVSITRDPDITGAFVAHNTLTANGSPGVRNDAETPFILPPAGVPEPNALLLLIGSGIATSVSRRRSR